LALVLAGEVVLAFDPAEGAGGPIAMFGCALWVAGLTQLRGLGRSVPALIAISFLTLILVSVFAVGDALALWQNYETLQPEPGLWLALAGALVLDGLQWWLFLDLIATVEIGVGRPWLARRARRLRVWYLGSMAVLVGGVMGTWADFPVPYPAVLLTLMAGFSLFASWLFRTWYLFEAVRACDRARPGRRRRKAGTPRNSIMSKDAEAVSSEG